MATRVGGALSSMRRCSIDSMYDSIPAHLGSTSNENEFHFQVYAGRPALRIESSGQTTRDECEPHVFGSMNRGVYECCSADGTSLTIATHAYYRCFSRKAEVWMAAGS